MSRKLVAGVAASQLRGSVLLNSLRAVPVREPHRLSSTLNGGSGISIPVSRIRVCSCMRTDDNTERPGSRSMRKVVPGETGWRPRLFEGGINESDPRV